jgi:tetratricopeptide (TPR) repeat protein
MSDALARKLPGIHVAHTGAGKSEPPEYCFPSRLEELELLQAAMRADPTDARAPYYLGNWMYDRRRHGEAIALWEQSAALDGSFATVWRNLGIAHFNIRRDASAAKAAYEHAVRNAPADARILYERDQLWKRVGEPPARRLAVLETATSLVGQRDDLTIEYCALLNLAGRHAEALELLKERRFQPWEGGEGLALGSWARTHLALGREELRLARYARAAADFETGLAGAPNLGETWHLLANRSELHYWAGVAHRAAGHREEMRRHLELAARAVGDFREMRVCAYSEMSYFSGMALRALGREANARAVFEGMAAYAKELAVRPARIDYFATSLPTMLLFEDDLQHRQEQQSKLLAALAAFGLGDKTAAGVLLVDILQHDPSHAMAAEFEPLAHP